MPNKNTKRTLYNARTNWDTYREYLNDGINLLLPLETSDNIDQAVQELTELIQYAAQYATPYVDRKSINSITYPLYIKDKILEKRKARRKWQLSRHPKDKNILNKLTRKLRNFLYDFKNDNIEWYIQNFSPHQDTDYSLWRATKKMKRPIQHQPPIRTEDGTWAREDKDKAETFAKHLSQTFIQHNIPTSQEEINNITKLLDSPAQDYSLIKHFSPVEIKTEIQYLNSKKAPGYDLITAKLLQELPKKAIMAITQIYNAVIKKQYFPIQWKFAEIILVPKPGKPPQERTSYRPISLLPVLSKLFEKLIQRRLLPIVNNSNIIPDHQFGFRKKHSAIECYVRRTP
ncbi:hypothetical protein KPH14_011921 [Odynerus spinipes]|uniref:Reverse transcriptase domain-containing protein n=1 Tax=Odynerus spinipes TaxID=1348599 RepID=A0AAD9VKY5_9HYME|nr:hypothetical protein KPH14_011921 [Odynerus spinipes]